MISLEQFAKSIAVLFDILGMAATYFPAIGPEIPITVVPKRPDILVGFGETNIHSEGVFFDVRTSEVNEPKAGDMIEYGDASYRIIGEPKRDVHRLVWTVEAAAL